MATSTVSKNPLFLVFPALSPEYLWRVVATETNRTVSRHKHLHTAVEKAEQLNLRAMEPPALPEPQYAQGRVYSTELPYCQMFFPTPGDSGATDQCWHRATIGDLETGCHFCAACFQEEIL